MSEAGAAVAFDVKQTDQGLRLTNWADKKTPHPLRSSLEMVAEWPEHLFVPRLFYLWAVDNEAKPDVWVKATAGRLFFRLVETRATYELAHPADGGHHWNLVDAGAS